MKNSVNAKKTLSLTIAAFLAISAILIVGTNNVFGQEAKFAVQSTQKSMQDPLPGHEKHQIVIILPPRDDGKFYS